MKTVTLDHPIPAGDNKSINEVQAGMPRLVHVQKLVLAIGPDTIAALMNRKEADSETLAPEDVKALLKAVMTEDRFDKFNEALGTYLGLEADQAGLLALSDLVKIGKEVAGFLPDLLEMVSELTGSPATS
jgi:hypothetical protein